MDDNIWWHSNRQSEEAVFEVGERAILEVDVVEFGGEWVASEANPRLLWLNLMLGDLCMTFLRFRHVILLEHWLNLCRVFIVILKNVEVVTVNNTYIIVFDESIDVLFRLAVLRTSFDFPNDSCVHEALVASLKHIVIWVV